MQIVTTQAQKMSLKKKNIDEEIEHPIFKDALIYKRGEYWQFRMWLKDESKYVRKSLNTTNKTIAISRAETEYLEILGNIRQGKKHFSLTTKEGVEKFLAFKKKQVDAEVITIGRWGTIKTHLDHWLKYIKKDAKLKDLKRTDCESYFTERLKTNKKLPVSHSTVMNEQSTINAMVKYLFDHHEIYFNSFYFPPVKRIDKRDENIRRASFKFSEVDHLEYVVIPDYIKEASKDLNKRDNLNKFISAYYFLIAINTGMRTGEQRQLRWCDIKTEARTNEDTGELESWTDVNIRMETTKTRKSRSFYFLDKDYVADLQAVLLPMHRQNKKLPLGECLIFSANGNSMLSQRTILYHFARLMELAEIENLKNRDLVPYSFRHYFITMKRERGGLDYSEIAEMCGNSPKEIYDTYYKITEDKKRSNARAGSSAH